MILFIISEKWRKSTYANQRYRWFGKAMYFRPEQGNFYVKHLLACLLGYWYVLRSALFKT